jgi:hypothetical protein
MADTQPTKPTVLGRSLRLTGNDLSFAPGDRGLVDLELIADSDNFLQAMQVMIETPFGSDVFNVNYGFDLLNSISLPETVSVIKELIRLNIIKSLSLDDRVKEIKAVAFNDEPAFFAVRPELNQDKSREQRKKERKWEAVIVLQTITGSEVALNLEGRGR